MRKPSYWFPTWSDTNQAVQLQKIARGLKFRIEKVEGLYYPCSENKGTGQLRGYRKADLRLCFRIMQSIGFLKCDKCVVPKLQAAVLKCIIIDYVIPKCAFRIQINPVCFL